MKFLDVENLVATQYVKPPFLIDGLVFSKTLNLLTGKPGTGKTMVLIDIMHRLDLGLPVFGSRLPDKRHTTLFVGADASQWYYHMQINLLWNGLGPQTESPTSKALFVTPGHKLTSPHFLALPPDQNDSKLFKFLDNAIEDYGADVVMFDTMRRFHNLEERNDQHAATFVEFLKWWRDTRNITIFFSHHERKSQANLQDSGTDRARGSVEWTAGFDSHYSISRRKNLHILDPSKVRGLADEDKLEIPLEFQNQGTSLVIAHGVVGNPSHKWINNVMPLNTPMTRAAIIAGHPSTDPTEQTRATDSAIDWMRRNGHITSVKRGTWSRIK